MSHFRGDGGSTSAAALTLLILMSAVTAGGALVLSGVISYTSRSAEREQLLRSLHGEGERVIRMLCSDPTFQADSPLDPVWAGLAASDSHGANVQLQDMSSRMNANWVRKELFQKTALRELLQPGSTAEDLQQRRQDRGLSVNIFAEYGDIIRKEALSRYFTGYSYANLNTADGDALRELYEARTGDRAGAEAFLAHWQQTLRQKKILKRRDLRDFLGTDYPRLYPLMNVEPSLNVHFVEPLLLAEILALPELNIPLPQQALHRILVARQQGEMSVESLQRLVGVAGDNLVYQYLGVTTWFWEVTVSRGTDRLELIVARAPSENGSPPLFTVTEERHFP